MSASTWRRTLQEMVRQFTSDFDIGHTGKGHLRVTIRGPHGEAVVHCGSTLKDRHSILNVRSDLRRKAAEIGMAVR